MFPIKFHLKYLCLKLLVDWREFLLKIGLKMFENEGRKGVFN